MENRGKMAGKKAVSGGKSSDSRANGAGDEKNAIRIAERSHKRCAENGKKKPSEMWPACRVHRLVEEIVVKLASKTI